MTSAAGVLERLVTRLLREGPVTASAVAVLERLVGRTVEPMRLSQVRRLQRNEIWPDENVCGRWQQ